MRWLTANADSILWREWDGESVVYLGNCATTHLLGGAAGAVLQALLGSEAALTIDELAARAFGTPASTGRAPGLAERPALPAEIPSDVASAAAPSALRADERAALKAIVLELERIGAARSLP